MPFISASVISPYNSIRGGAEGGLVPLLLDLYPNAVAAYSLRKLRTAYSGPAIEAIKTVGGETFVQDIGFVDNELDTASLLTFANGGDVSVAKWYDQSTNGFNVFNNAESAQPKIVIGGVLQTESSKPCINLSANPDYFLSNDFGSSSVIQKTLIIVGRQTTASDTFGAIVSSFDDTPNNRIFTGRNGNDYASFASGVEIANAWTTYENQYLLHFSAADVVGNGQWHINSSLAGTGTTTTGYNGIAIGRTRNLGLYAAGTIQEVILYPTDQSANREGIESNINSNYKIYWDGSQTGLLDDYPNASAAYSLRALNSAYTGPAIEARRSSDDAVQDIGFLYDGSLDTESLLTFAEGGDVFVAKWYDQSGGGYDSLQPFAAQQPQIVDLGSVVTLNGKPTILSSVGKAMYTTSNSVPVVGDLGERSSFSVLNSNASGLQVAISYVDGGTNLFFPIAFNTGIAFSRNNDPASNATAPYTANSDVVFTSLLNSTNSEVFLNGVSGGGVTGFIPQTGTSKINVFARYANVWSLVGQVSEIILYPSDQTANRVEIETNINNHYTIYP